MRPLAKGVMHAIPLLLGSRPCKGVATEKLTWENPKWPEFGENRSSASGNGLESSGRGQEVIRHV